MDENVEIQSQISKMYYLIEPHCQLLCCQPCWGFHSGRERELPDEMWPTLIPSSSLSQLSSWGPPSTSTHDSSAVPTGGPCLSHVTGRDTYHNTNEDSTDFIFVTIYVTLCQISHWQDERIPTHLSCLSFLPLQNAGP